jgi:hypothetical protein
MGLSCGHATNYTIDDLSFDNIITILQHRKMRRLQDPGGPVVDVDASWVVRRCTNMSYDMRVSSMMRPCLKFINSGCRVNIVLDGVTRHHTKRSTIKRMIDCHCGKVDFHINKCELSELIEEKKTLISQEEKIDMDKKIETKKKQMASAKKKLSEAIVDVGEKLLLKIKEKLIKIQYDGFEKINEVLTYMVAEFQADSVIAYRTNQQMNDIVICSDSDQAAHTWNHCVCIKSYLVSHISQSKSKHENNHL